ncbi:MAG: hypothetical protein H7274_17095 [Rhodoferax sp.]|nr:hypothetical protein [Rhodoferax sp.]
MRSQKTPSFEHRQGLRRFCGLFALGRLTYFSGRSNARRSKGCQGVGLSAIREMMAENCQPQLREKVAIGSAESTSFSSSVDVKAVAAKGLMRTRRVVMIDSDLFVLLDGGGLL